MWTQAKWLRKLLFLKTNNIFNYLILNLCHIFQKVIIFKKVCYCLLILAKFVLVIIIISVKNKENVTQSRNGFITIADRFVKIWNRFWSNWSLFNCFGVVLEDLYNITTFIMYNISFKTAYGKENKVQQHGIICIRSTSFAKNCSCFEHGGIENKIV